MILLTIMTTFCLKNSNSRNSNYNFKKDKFSQMCANTVIFTILRVYSKLAAQTGKSAL